ncbi:orotidine 5'-phosphate decarboxylase [Clostridia bacterium]|nr:orotidine 5'-phosphate decarboxylase [Clostridia bacterium]
MDRLISEILTCGAPVVVGLDPTLGMIPERIKKENLEKYGVSLKAAAGMLLDFNKEIIDAIYDIVPAVKPQIAMYEQFGPEGVAVYAATTTYAREKGMVVIGDVKRGDIASTAEAYAAHIKGVCFEDVDFEPWCEDAVTLNPYLGIDGIEPFIRVCESRNKGIFVLVKTSNPSSSQLQDLLLKDKEITVFEHIADLVSEWGRSTIGSLGYSSVGAVVGATFAEQGAALRKRMPHTFFLVPGYGAQGATGRDLRGFFDRDGKGCIVNSSRGIIAAWQKNQRFGENDIGEAARQAAMDMIQDLSCL